MYSLVVVHDIVSFILVIRILSRSRQSVVKIRVVEHVATTDLIGRTRYKYVPNLQLSVYNNTKFPNLRSDWPKIVSLAQKILDI